MREYDIVTNKDSKPIGRTHAASSAQAIAYVAAQIAKEKGHWTKSDIASLYNSMRHTCRAIALNDGIQQEMKLDDN